VRTPKSGRYLPKNVSGDGWTPAWIAFAELRMPFVVSSVPKRSIATSSIINQVGMRLFSPDSPLEERVKSEPVSENGSIPDDSGR
jgi:hypothetical protein